MIYRWFWRCSSDPNTHSSFTGTSWVSEERKTFSRPADGRKMKRDHPNCWTAQLNTIVKTFFPVCVCVNSTDDRVWHWSSTLSSVTQSPDGAGPSSRCRVSSAAPPSLLAQLTMWFIKNLLYKKTEFFSPVRKRETQVFLCSKVQRTERSAASWEVSCFNCSVFIQCIKTEEWGRSGNDVQTPTCMNILSIYQYIHQ